MNPSWPLFLTCLLTCLLGAQTPAPPAGLAPFQAAAALAAQDRNPQALPLAQAALALRAAALAPGHPDLAQSQLQVGRLLNATDQQLLAQPLLLQASASLQTAQDPRGEGDAANALLTCFSHRDDAAALAWGARALERHRACGNRVGEAEALLGQGSHHAQRHRLAEAQASLLQAQALFQELDQPAGKAAVLYHLAVVADRQGDLPLARSYLDQALPLCRSAGRLGLEGLILQLSGSVLGMGSNWAAAIAPLEQALERCTSAGYLSGAAGVRHDLGLAYWYLGNNAQARPYLEAALAGYLALARHSEAAEACVDLAGAHDGPENEEDRALRAQALALARQAKDPHREAEVLYNTGDAHRWARRYDEARQCLEQALAIHRQYQDQRAEALDLRGLSNVLGLQGQPEEALRHIRPALAYHQATGQVWEQIQDHILSAWYLAGLARFQESTAHFASAVGLEEGVREGAFPLLTETQKLSYTQEFQRTREGFIWQCWSALRQGPPDPRALQLCFDGWLAHKGSVLDAQERFQQALLQAREPAVRALAAALTQTRLAYATLAQNRPPNATLGDYPQRLQALAARREAQEGELAALNQRFAAGVSARRLDSAGLGQLLAKDAVYLDFARVQPMEFKNLRYARAHYLAFVLRAGAATPALVDLGPAEPLEAQIQALHANLQAGRAVAADLGALHRKLIAPLEPHLTGAAAFTLSPAGALHLVPFELLGPTGGQPLMDRGPVGYVTSGRDLARYRNLSQGNGTLAILADPDFNLGLTPAQRRAKPAAAFPRLPGTKTELRAIRQAFPRHRGANLSGAAAREAALLALPAPWVLHLATHSYFLPDEPNPMLGAGLALAGANAGVHNHNGTGLFSAEKVTGLNLSATSLVVLSACSTGLGQIQNGEGVLGLRRAFILAGAQTLMVSLWPVPDAATQKLMALFYRNLARGMAKAQALQQAKQAMRARQAHPRDWAGFVLVGNPN